MRSLATLATAVVSFALLTLSSVMAHAQSSRLPWPAAQRISVTQDCNDTCCNDHVGFNTFAWDFATEGAFPVLAPRAGTVAHVKMSSNRGGADASEVDHSNYLVLDHGDGTYSVMLHLAYGSLDPAVRCGEFVRQGQRLAMSGSTGWSSGNHLHYQVNRIPSSMNRVCECGPDGMGCAPEQPNWELFWSYGANTATLPVQFEEWQGASMCGDRHDDNVLESRNADSRETVVTIDEEEPGRFAPVRGNWSVAPGGARGSYRQAASGAASAAMLSFRGAVTNPGVYEVWSALPVRGRNVGASEATAEVVARGGRGRTVVSQNQPGGGYHPVAGRFKLTGREGEGIMFASAARSAEALAVDGVVLRRVGDAGNVAEGGACASSVECSGDMVCGGGRCRAGCEVAACGAGESCDATGLCVTAPAGSAPAASQPAVVAPPRVRASLGSPWSTGARAAVQDAASVRGGGPSGANTARGRAGRAVLKRGGLDASAMRDLGLVAACAMLFGLGGLLVRRKRR